MFSGTSCQINGLKLFLGKEYENLFCVDVICHGVPSPELWKKYISYIEDKHNKKVKSVNFRCKDHGWKTFGIKKNEIYISKDEDPYMQMFLRDYCLRPSCYDCKSKKHKMSDMTIADFWGIENVAPDMDDGQGTSLILLRSQKGLDIFNNISPKLKFKEVSYEDSVKSNPSEYKSVKRPPQRNDFFNDMNDMDFEALCNKYVPKTSFFTRIKIKTKKVIKLIIKMPFSGRDYGTKFVLQKEDDLR